ncbi:MAG: hypothetical protein AB7G93_11575 [Bdellovibrionales bacterium]
MKRYAQNTSVSADRSESEIRNLVQKYGAEQFFSGATPELAFIAFRLKDRFVKITLPLARKDSNEGHPKRYVWGEDGAKRENRQRWRALVLDVKAKLVSVDSGIRTVEQAFYYDIVMPGGKTIGQLTSPQVAEAYRTGQDIKLLPGL